ncbi:hypothetical protein [Alicyclobacillus macrosporangiidus]|uniref:hypothetical protein n=1 Tax=Alicyclobacillus macrosporangiidus TaxID=392015 RepID=UPI0004968AE6|nr:hypothetical protein [Alicyclobacillus macrosporangiidus]
MVKKSFYVWVFRSISTIILVFIVAGVVNSLAGRPIYVLLNIIISPFTFVHHLMPKDTAWDGWKFIYTGMVLILELILCSGLVAFVYDVIRLGRSQFSESTLNAMARLLAQIEHSIQSIWDCNPTSVDSTGLPAMIGSMSFTVVTSR